MNDPLAVLSRIRSWTPGPPPAPAAERCELCCGPIEATHRHLVDLAARSLLCACQGCHLLLAAEGAGGGHYRSVPDRYVALPGVWLSPQEWDALQIPVGVAFFFENSSVGRVAAFYPGPAGATESQLALQAWQELAEAHPELATLAPDVEALLVRALPGAGARCWLVPIDACYELVGRLRRLWRGFDGGQEARRAIDEFFASIDERAR